MKHIKKWIAAAGVGLVLMTATVAALPAAAAETAAVQVQRGGIGQSAEYLAQALGVTADELEAAKQTAYQAALDQALAQGLITQEQAGTIQAHAEAAGRLSSRYLRSFTSGDPAIDLDALLAEALGVTTDQLAAARVEAQNLALAAAVESGRITQEQADQARAQQALKSYMQEQGLQTQIQTLYENLVKQAVQAGVITQEQADTLLSSQRSFGGHHGRGGMRMPGTRNFQTPDSSSSSPSRYFQLPAVTGSDL